MSKNIGLLQRQMVKKLPMRLLAERRANPRDAHQKGNGHASIVRLGLDGAAPEKRVELVERIFWSQGKVSRRVIAFVGNEAGESCGRMPARVAEILARPLFGKVGWSADGIAVGKSVDGSVLVLDGSCAQRAAARRVVQNLRRVIRS